MKSERRQREQNDLAHYLEKIIRATQEYHTTILTVIVGVVLLAIVVSAYRGIVRSNTAAAWGEVYSLSGVAYLPPDHLVHGFQPPLMQSDGFDGGPSVTRPNDFLGEADIKKLAEFGKANAHKPVGVVALLQAGNSLLQEMAEYVQGNRLDEVKSRVGEALEILQLAESKASEDLKPLAQLAVARAYEMAAIVENTKENLEKAKAMYEKVATSGSPLAMLAKEMTATLERPETEEIYAALKQRLSNVDISKEAAQRGQDMLWQGGFTAPGVQETVPWQNALPPVDGAPEFEFKEIFAPGNTGALPENTEVTAPEAAPVEEKAPEAAPTE